MDRHAVSRMRREAIHGFGQPRHRPGSQSGCHPRPPHCCRLAGGEERIHQATQVLGLSPDAALQSANFGLVPSPPVDPRRYVTPRLRPAAPSAPGCARLRPVKRPVPDMDGNPGYVRVVLRAHGRFSER